MDYDRLTVSNWRQQVSRVVELRDKIVARETAVMQGRVVPDDSDLAIGTGRRLNMAIMFLDLCGFSGRQSESQNEQELLMQVLNLFFTEMIKIAEEYGGVVEKNTGDGLMAYFNDNEGDPPEDGCKRAVACALTMLYANANLINPILRASRIEELKFRIGIDYGSVTIAQIGAAKRFGSLAAIGTTANVACKILDVAGPDEIVLGENVVRRLPPAWRSQWCILKKADTRWSYQATGSPYRFFAYIGRWIQPR